MSEIRYGTTHCPKCRKENRVTIYDSLNAQLNPEENQQFLEGKLFQYTCECGHTANINYPMLYTDTEQNLMMYYVNNNRDQRSEDCFRNSSGAVPFEGVNFNYRIVESQNALYEKASIFKNNFDDKIVELIKLFCFIRLREKRPDIKIYESIFHINENNKLSIEFLASENVKFNVSYDFYEEIKAKYEDKLKDVGNNEMYIDRDWAVNFLVQN